MTGIMRLAVRLFAAAGLWLLAWPGMASAQYIENYFPANVPGYGEQQGVTVLSRLRPLYQERGMRLGDIFVNAGLGEGLGYDSNISGVSHGPGSWFLRSSPYVNAYSDWSRDSMGFSATVDNYTYFSQPGNNYTNWSTAIGGGYTIGRHDLNLGYSHFQLHELGTDIGGVPTSTPLPYTVDDLRSDYTFEAGRFSFIPNVDVRYYQFGTATLAGVPTSQTFRDRVVVTGGLTTRYALSDQRNLIFVLEGVNSSYVRPTSGQPSNNNAGILALAGLDYQATGPWRYRVLVGGEVRTFAAAQFGTQAAPIIEGSVIWTPTGLTTVTGTVVRTIEDPASEGTAGYVLTSASMVVDHEYRRNILLQGRAGFQSAQYLSAGGSTTNFSVGGGITWLLNPHARLSADYDFTDQNGNSTALFSSTQQPTSLLSGSYTRSVFVLALHLAL